MYVILDRAELNHLINTGQLVILRNNYRHCGVAQIKTNRKESIGTCHISLLGSLVKKNHEILVQTPEGTQIPLSNFIKHTPYPSTSTLLKKFHKKTRSRIIKNAKVYFITLLKLNPTHTVKNGQKTGYHQKNKKTTYQL